MDHRGRRGLRLAPFLLLLVLVLVVGCAGDDGGTTDPPPGEEPFFPSDFLDDYQEALSCRQFSIGHDNNTVAIWIDPISGPQYVSRSFESPLPEGTIIVKREFAGQECDVPIRITAMRKGPPGTAPGSGDWEWQELDGNGVVLESGQIGDCIACHTDDPCGAALDFTCWDGNQSFHGRPRE